MKIGIRPANKARYVTIIGIAFPIIIQEMILYFQLMIDRAWLGHLEVGYLSAMGNALIPYFTITSFLFALSIGGTIIIAQRIGAGEFKKAREYAEVSFLVSTLFSIGLFLFWYFGANTIFKVMGTSDEVLKFSTPYIRIIIISLLFFGIDLTTVSIFQGSGHTVPIMITGLLKNALNLFLDWVLIFGHWGFPRMEIHGAAWATTFSNIIGTLLLFSLLFFSKKIPFKISIIGIIKAKWHLYKDIFKIGFPSGLEGLLWHLGQLVAIRFLNEVDENAAGIYMIVFGIQLVALFMYSGIAKAGTTLIGQKWGAKKYKEGRYLISLCLKLSLAICALVSLIFIIFPKQIAGIFTSDGPTLAQSIPLIYIIAIIVYFQALNMVAGAAIRGTGDTRWMFGSQLFGTVFIMAVAALCIFVLNMGIMGVFVATLADEVVRGMVNLYRFKTGKNPVKTFWLFFRKTVQNVS